MLKKIFKFREFDNEQSDIKTKTKHLTDEERARIIEEEALRAEIRAKTDPVAQEIDGFKSTARFALFIGAIIMSWYVWAIVK